MAVSLYVILISLITLTTTDADSFCTSIAPEAREACLAGPSDSSWTQSDCLSVGCCWDEQANSSDIKCFQKGCKAGFFGWGCQFRCRCLNGNTCDNVTGKCENGCPRDRWGVGCLLDNNCTYNDPSAILYMGKKSRTAENKTCISWTRQRAYQANQFPEEDLALVMNYCRNPKPNDARTWCYWSSGNERKWGFCNLTQCACPLGRFSTNCQNECHCNNTSEQCSQSLGLCQSGCHPRWTGTGCQECADGYFGAFCQSMCHCGDDSEVCDKSTGVCQSGCLAGWTGMGCQTECVNGYFGVNCELACNCKSGADICNKSTGACPSGCKTGYAGDGCQIQLPIMTRIPEISSRNATSLSVKWRDWTSAPGSGMGPVVGYVVYYRRRNETSWKALPQTTLKMLTVTSLVSETVYHISVAAVHQSGLVGPPSPHTAVSTCGRPLSGPGSLKIEVQSSDDAADDGYGEHSATDSSVTERISLLVQWELLSRDRINCVSLLKFSVYTRGASATDELTFIRSGAVTRRTVITNVDPFANLTVGVSLINNAGLESVIEHAYYVGKSGAVRSLEVASQTSSSLKISWTAPSASNALVEYYLWSYRELHPVACPSASAAWNPLMDVDSDKTELELTDLSPYTRYELKIWPFTMAGQGRAAHTFGTTAAAVPGKVDGVLSIRLTSTSVRLTWRDVDCRQYNGEFVGYTYELSRWTTSSADRFTSVVYSMVNASTVDLDSLVPFTNYSFEVWLSNRKFDGPRTRLNFTTLEDIPPAPRAPVIQTKLSNSLVIAWEPPYPPHGVIVNYTVKFQQQLKFLPPTVLFYNFTDLEPNTLYSVQVKGATRIGEGPWSELLEAATDESVPSEPRSFVNTSRTATSVTFEWSVPLKPNGILQDYKLTCMPATTFGRFVARGTDLAIQSTLTKFTVTSLLPGTCYVCTLKASTRKGYGGYASKVIWTEPHIGVNIPRPLIDKAKTTDSTLALVLTAADPIVNMEEADSLYRIVVERLSASKKSVFKRHSSSSPCHMSHSELSDYFTALQRGDACYVAAEILIIEHEKLFIVGDNKTHGGFYNAPLLRTEKYHVWFGLFVTVDGVTASSYISADTGEVLSDGNESPVSVEESDNNVGAMAGAAVGAILAVVLIVFVIVFIVFKSGVIQRRQLQLERYNLHSCDTSDPADTMSKNRDNRGLLAAKTSEAEEMEEVSESRAEMVPLFTTGQSLSNREPPASGHHHPIPVNDLYSYVARKKMDGGLRAEYQEILQGLHYKCDTARRLENKTKNRYGNIVAYDHSRVILNDPEDGNTDYINANYIDGYMNPSAFVATQGPSKHTLNDMWRMIWQLKCTRIVMVSNLTEDGRHKCEQYWPESGSRQFGDITVDSVDVEQFADFKIRTFTLTRNETKTTVRQFHFTTWPDHGVPAHPTSLLAFHKKFRSFQDPSTGPAVVHCSAGVGRTGTFIAIDYLLDQSRVEGRVDVFECVRQMRSKRVNMVQTPEQYVFVYDALLEAFKCGDTSIPCVDFRSRFAELKKINAETGKSFCQDEFQLLASVTQTTEIDKTKIDGLNPDNINKNRVADIVPVNKFSRPYLLTYIAGSTDYINAVFADGYKQRDAFIVTQAPLPNTIVDFWTMIHDHSCRTIVMMNDIDPADRTLGNYFPLSAGSQTHGPFTVELMTIDSMNPHVTVRDLMVTFNKRGTKSNPVLVRHFQFLAWPGQQSVPVVTAVLSLLNMLEKWQQRSGNGVITVHCLDGATRSGLLCALSYMVERLKVEQDVDVFQSVKHARTNRSQIVPTFEQYRYLYDTAVEYMDCFETYSNFK